MANKKKQHYVSQFYLKNFSADENRKSIHTFVVGSKQVRHFVGITGQCQNPYMYGKDLRTENFLGDFETMAGKVIRKVIQENSLKYLDLKEIIVLRIFIILSTIRHQRRKEMERQLKAFLYEDTNGEIEKIFPDFNDSNFNIFDAMRDLLIDMFIHSMDLKMELIYFENGGFITSDNPVLMHNQFFRRYNRDYGSLGFAARGIQIFLPISPSHIIMIYDDSVYKTRGDLVKIKEEDVRLLNSFQVLNCDTCIYFSSKQHFDKYVPDKYFTYHSRNTGEMTFVKGDLIGKPNSKLINPIEKRSMPSLPLSFLKVTKHFERSTMGLIVHPRYDIRMVERFVNFFRKEENIDFSSMSAAEIVEFVLKNYFLIAKIRGETIGRYK